MTRAPDRVPGGLVTLSEDLWILAVNDTMAELVDRSPDELAGQSFDVLLSAPSQILLQTNVYPALRAEGRVEEVFLSLTHLDGSPVPVLFNATRSTDGDRPVYEGLAVRIRARARWEAELLAATRALQAERAASERMAEDLAATARDLEARYAEEQRNRAFRDAFIGIVSHELRTPITTIFGMSHVLRQRHETMDPDAIRQHLEDIETESDRLRRLTEDLLVLGRAEGGGLHLADDPILVGHVVRHAVDSERRRSPSHRFDMDIGSGLTPVLGEELALEQVVRNYLGNAAKYSPAGTTIRTTVAPEDGGVAVRVIDEGPGLGDQDPERLFDLFHRAPEVMRHVSGAGIGLFVCRELVGAMGGRVWARSASGADGGTEFGFWLPAAVETDGDVD